MGTDFWPLCMLHAITFLVIEWLMQVGRGVGWRSVGGRSAVGDCRSEVGRRSVGGLKCRVLAPIGVP